MPSEPTSDYIILLDPVFQLNADLGEKLLQSFCACQPPPESEVVGKIVAMVGDWFTRNFVVAEALVAGCCDLLSKNAGQGLDLYLDAVSDAGRVTPVLARSAAEKFVVICAADDALLYDLNLGFFRDIGPWGPYPLGQVTNGVLALFEVGGAELATSFARMVGAALQQGVVEKELVRLVERLVTGIKGLDASKRLWQTTQLERVIVIERHLAPAFLRGFERGVRFLKEPQLKQFVTAALTGDDRGERRSRFLGLEAISSRDLCRQLQTMAPLATQLTSLHRYLNARSGKGVSVRPLSEIPLNSINCRIASCTDGKKIFLPSEMESGRTVKENETRYRLLSGLELALIEAQSFTFDFSLWQRLRRHKGLAASPDGICGDIDIAPPEEFKFSDYYTFFALFPYPELAEKLFNLAEFTRVRGFLEQYYPGFAKRVKIITDYCQEPLESALIGTRLAHYLYQRMVLGHQIKGCGSGLLPKVMDEVVELLEEAEILQNPQASVLVSADWVTQVYGRVVNLLRVNPGGFDIPGFANYCLPFGRRLHFDLVYRAHHEVEKKAHLWREDLGTQGVDVDKGLLKNILSDENQELTPEILRQLLEHSGKIRNPAGGKLKRIPRGVDLEKFFPENSAAGATLSLSEPVPTFWYDEWDFRLNDYLKHHVKLLEHRRMGGDSSFYRQAITDNDGLIHRIRRNFELIRPEAIQILRHWPEGDAFDYDALLEYALDRKMRITPDERLYRKRLKVDRDVAVFVLVDLSSSTRKAVKDGSDKSILAVEKEALVLFCEALERVGDTYALAGFSGSGRLATEFFYLKGFDEPLNDQIKGRIGGVRPEKNTRMGPAIRHAAKELKEYPARVKLMIILSDGLPNDQDYINEYAIADSRSAIRESRSSFIHVHAITVNTINSSHLDNLYGDVHHTVIADVKQLPDKLPRIYRALTRQ